MARDLSTPLAASEFDGQKRKRSKRVYDRSEKVAAKGRRAVDEGRDKKATRLLKKAARLENRSINIEDREFLREQHEAPLRRKKRKECSVSHTLLIYLHQIHFSISFSRSHPRGRFH